MGYRLHYATTYKVRYDGGYFNWKIEEINNLLLDLFPNACFDEDEIAYATGIELSKEDFKSAFERLNNYTTEQLPAELREAEYTVNDIKDFLEIALEESDKENDYVKLKWF